MYVCMCSMHSWVYSMCICATVWLYIVQIHMLTHRCVCIAYTHKSVCRSERSTSLSTSVFEKGSFTDPIACLSICYTTNQPSSTEVIGMHHCFYMDTVYLWSYFIFWVTFPVLRWSVPYYEKIFYWCLLVLHNTGFTRNICMQVCSLPSTQTVLWFTFSSFSY